MLLRQALTTKNGRYGLQINPKIPAIFWLLVPVRL